MTHWITALFLISRLLAPLAGSDAAVLAGLRTAQAAVEINDLGVVYQFGEQVTFQAEIHTTQPIDSVVIYITPAGQATVWQTADLSAGLRIEQSVDARQLNLRPFSSATYRYQVNLTSGESINSPEHSFRYEDNRFAWQSLDGSDFVVYWYGRDPSFGQAVLNIARQGLQRAQTILDLPAPQPLKIYVYASSRELQSALQLNNQPWVAGHASPDLHQLLISIPTGPEQKLELERQVPHELMHILQYQQVGDKYRQQPVWLLEGMASIAELYPNPEYNYVLTTSAANHDLLPISSLCASFPRESSGAYKAYAQAESFVRFLHQTYGSSGLLALMRQYDDGLGCEEGLAAAFGQGMPQLEYRWKQEMLGINAAGLALNNLSPYLAVMLVLAAPAVLSLLPALRRKPQPGVLP